MASPRRRKVRGPRTTRVIWVTAKSARATEVAAAKPCLRDLRSAPAGTANVDRVGARMESSFRCSGLPACHDTLMVTRFESLVDVTDRGLEVTRHDATTPPTVRLLLDELAKALPHVPCESGQVEALARCLVDVEDTASRAANDLPACTVDVPTGIDDAT